METLKRDYKKFFTPSYIAKYMVGLLNPQTGDAILEPSAGDGAIVRAIKERNAGCIVFAFELNEEHKPYLRNAGANIVVIKDFLETPDYAKFTSCCANPPFGNGIDLQAHFDLMCKLVQHGGKMVMILPQDFIVPFEHVVHPIENWSTNKDGTTTPIKIVEFLNIQPIEKPMCGVGEKNRN